MLRLKYQKRRLSPKSTARGNLHRDERTRQIDCDERSGESLSRILKWMHRSHHTTIIFILLSTPELMGLHKLIKAACSDIVSATALQQVEIEALIEVIIVNKDISLNTNYVDTYVRNIQLRA